MSELTKCWLQQAITGIETIRDDMPFGLDEDEQKTLAALKMALSVLDAKPVIYEAEINGVMSSVTKSHYDACKMFGVPVRELFTTPPAASEPVSNGYTLPDGLVVAVNRLLDSDGSRGTFSAIRRGDALAEVERLLAAAPAPEQ